jgi:BMFP domain-containing protein YqiC
MNAFHQANGSMPIDLAHIDELARRLSSLVPGSLRDSREELQQNFKSVLQTGLGKLDLVTRDEFELQRAVARIEAAHLAAQLDTDPDLR